MAKSKIEAKATAETTAESASDFPAHHPGLEDGAIVESLTHTGERVKHKVVYDYDKETKEMVGWHMKAVK